MLLTSRALVVLTLLLAAPAWAQRETTSEALSRLEETLEQRLAPSHLSPAQLTPVIVVSTRPSFEETRSWFPNAAVTSLTRVFGTAVLRVCAACMAPRLNVDGSTLDQNSADLDAGEIARMDESLRGTAAPARAAIWLDENPTGVSLRIVLLADSRIVLAENLDPQLKENERTIGNYKLADDLTRRARGEALVHTFIDATVYPNQHISFDWVEQFGDKNRNLAGITISAIDPVLGLGASYYRIIPEVLNLNVGAQVVLSLPTAIASAAAGKSLNVLDPLVTGVFLVRVPIFKTNYAVVGSASTQGHFGVGLSITNFSFLPILP